MAFSNWRSVRLASAIQMRVSAGIKLNSGSTDSWRLWSPMLGTTTALVILLTLSWEMGSNFRMESTSSPKNSMR